MASTDPIDCLVEIAQAVMDRMNDHHEVGNREAFVLGRIMGITNRIPEVLVRLHQFPEEAED